MSKAIAPQLVFDEILAAVSLPERAQASAAMARALEAANGAVPEAAIAVMQSIVTSLKNGKTTAAIESIKESLPRLREALGLPKTNAADLIWRTAELLRGAYKEAEYRRVVLPFTVLRRLDCLLEPTKAALLKKHEEISKKRYDPAMFLPGLTGYPFWNSSKFTMKALLEAPNELRENLEDMVNGFSPNVRRIFEKFSFIATLDKLKEKGRLLHVVQAFAKVPMDMYSVSSHDMGKAFEELLRRFNEESPAGEQYTPRDAIHLMVDILLDGDDEVLSVPGVVRTMCDPTAGTGGMLSETDERIHQLNPNARIRLFGQELEDETYAICMADILIRGQNPADIALGDTLADDKHPDERFDYQLSNPPYGVEWKPAQKAVEDEHAKGAAGRFGPGLPRISDGQMLFDLHMLSKMRPYVNGKGGGRIGVVHNGSPLFTGDAGSGESEIRRHILEHDYLDAIVALPTDMFYNTNIATYLWFMTNRKPAARKGKVILIDASAMGVLMKKNLGKKRFELSDDCRDRILNAYHEFKEVAWADGQAVGGRKRQLKAKVFNASHFFYRKVTIERPLRQRFEVTKARAQAFLDEYVGPKGEKLSSRRDTELQNIAVALGAIAVGGEPTFMSQREFVQAIHASEAAIAKRAKLSPVAFKPKALDAVRKFFGVRDKQAAIVVDDKGEAIADTDLRDAEYVPFSRLGKDVAAGVKTYFEAEVKPHWPDAWVNEEVVDKSDSQVGIVGCEINFNREFYVYQPPRSRDAILADIKAMETRFMEMLKGVAS